MAKLQIEGIAPLDGLYDLQIGAFTNRELHTIKEISGVRAGELKEAIEAGDNDLMVAFAAIVLARAGKQFTVEQIWEADTGQLIVIPDAAVEEQETRPPISASTNGSESSHVDAGSSSEHASSSGPPSDDDGDSRASSLSRIGSRGSDVSSLSDLAI